MTTAFILPLIVLVVEDQVLIRMTAADLFEDAGFEVIEAANSREALAALALRSDIAVLFADVDLPGGINGYKLAQSARLTHPRLVVMMVSGRQWPDADDLPSGGRFVAKPYNAPAMVASVRQMIAAA